MPTTAREAALAALERCRKDNAWSGASIDNAIKNYALDKRDAALASRLCLGVLQNGSYCDYYIDYYASGKLEPRLRDILRMGVYQLLFLDKIPQRAAVNESVALCKAKGFSRASGLVNAVLRRIAENKDRLPEIPGEGTAGYLSVKYSHPLWLAEHIIAEHGYAFAEAFFASNNSAAPLTIQINTLKVSAQDYKRALLRADTAFERCEAMEGCISFSGGAVTALPGFDEGLFYVQDKAARAAVEIAQPRAGMKVLDACAAPGGKSFALAIAMENRGSVLSCDIHEKKLGLIRNGAQRLGIDIIETEPRDARAADEGLNSAFDIVLADVPCSGLGVIRKKPEIRKKSLEELSKLPEIQAQILRNLSAFVKPGGTLLYSTCTILKAENEAIVQSFLEENADFELAGFELAGIKADSGMYSFWPHVDGTDGFFAAKIIRKQ